MRFLLPLLLLFALDYYTFQAFQTAFSTSSKWSRQFVFGVFWAVPVLAILTAFSASASDVSTWPRGLFSTVRAILVLAYFSKLVIALAFLGGDVWLGLQKTWTFFVPPAEPFSPSRSAFLAKTAILLGALPFATLTYGIVRNAYRYRVRRSTVPILGLPDGLDGLKIVQISDIHAGSFGQKEGVEKGIELINAERPDLVFFTGDLVNSVASEIEPFIDIFKKIEARFGVFSITGNHDYGDYSSWPSREAKLENWENFKKAHQKMGWDLLLNENRILEIRGEKLAVIGVENFSGKPQFQKYGDLAASVVGSEDVKTKILLSHDPSHWDFEVRKSFSDIQLMLAGHTHGFQFGIEIPGWIEWSPAKWMYKQWAGLYQKDDQFLYVNRGFGFLGYPGRVGILPEIAVLELKKA